MKENVYSVSQVSRYISRMLQEDFLLREITIRGEISNLKYHTSGHIYFTLKDTASQISAIMFAGDRAGLPFKLENGFQVLCTGRVALYEKGGSYQIYVKRISMDGIGDLYIRFEQLKKELAEMGMFDDMYKKPIPRYAMRIGIVTAKTGAAVRDIIQIAKRRNPYCELILYPALVQGENAAASIVEGIEILDRMGLDVLIVGRGGGSLEDLWAFNEESVAKAIFDADTPIVSAVGHETDTTIADFVADLRAPTPSAAAELCVFDYQKLERDIRSYADTLSAEMRDHIAEKRQQLDRHRLLLQRSSPEMQMMERRQRAAELREKLRRCMLALLTENKERLQPYQQLRHDFSGKLQGNRHRLALLTERLEAASPLKRLEAGFACLETEDGQRIRSAASLHPGELVVTTLSDGSFRSRVEDITIRGNYGSSKEEKPE